MLEEYLAKGLVKEGKICTKCGEWKTYVEFHLHVNSKDGYKSACKKCRSIEHKIRYRKRLENLTDKNKSKILRIGTKRKKAANRIIGHALDKGYITKSLWCQICGTESKNIVGHHPNYDKPLEVIWICSSCHKLIHNFVVID